MNTRTLRYAPATASAARPADWDPGSALIARAAQHAQKTLRPGADPRYDGAISLFDPRAAGYHDPILVTANSYVGTKLKLAMITGLHEAVGIDIAANAANAMLAHGAEPLSFHYYHSCGTADLEMADRLLAGIAEGCRQSGATLVGGRTIEMPGVFEDGEYDLSGFCSGAVERSGLLPRPDCNEGDVLLGLAASSPHAHGFNLIRRIVSNEELGYHDPAPFAPNLSLGQALMLPTRSYARVVGAVLRASPSVKCIMPITDSGLHGSIARALPQQIAARVDLASWRLPPIYQWLREVGALTAADLLNNFNCGLGMVLVVDKLRTVSALKVLRDIGEKPLAIGTLVNRVGGDPVRFSGGFKV